MDLDDLNRAIDATKRALNLNKYEYRDRAMLLNNLGIHLGRRAERVKSNSLHDLKQAIEASKEAVDITPGGRVERATWLVKLGAWHG